jgi:hypothetical protein
MKKIIPYLLIAVAFVIFIFSKHPDLLSYKFNQDVVKNYLRSQDIEDPNELIKDRIFISDSDIYLASGYLYAKGDNPAKYNFQHPPLIKYLFGYSVLLTGNPYWVQLFFGLVFLLLTYFLSSKILKYKWMAVIPSAFILSDPLFGNVISGCYLDLGQAVFAISFIILALYFPKKYFWVGLSLGLFAGSKFWSTAVMVAGLTYLFKFIIQKEKFNFLQILSTISVSLLVYLLTYTKYFLAGGWLMSFIELQGRIFKFMLSHNSAGQIGGSILLFATGFFTPWWKGGVERAVDWSLLWPIGLISSVVLVIKSKFKGVELFIYLLPAIYLLLISTGVPFTRYFVIILPFIYISLTKLFLDRFYSHK